ncbi:MAG TPA: AlpA family phage regulatory protein [Candidatus Binatia bacterium]|nr:AlpA family phage regulatory protein [Candidatus Binatia bacterium]
MNRFEPASNTEPIAQGSFPKPISLGGRAVGWLEAEIQEWLQSLSSRSVALAPGA